MFYKKGTLMLNSLLGLFKKKELTPNEKIVLKLKHFWSLVVYIFTTHGDELFDDNTNDDVSHPMWF